MANTEKAGRRATITPDSFSVSPDLLGLPLARPWRRGSAMLIDLAGIALLARAGAVFLAIALALTLWRASGQSTPKRRVALRVTAIALPIVMLAWCGNPLDRDSSEERSRGNVAALDGDWTQLAAIPDLITLESSRDSAEIARAAHNLATRLTSSGLDADVRRDIREDLIEEIDNLDARAMLRSAFDTMDALPTESALVADSAVLRYADAIGRGDTIEAESLRSGASEALAGHRIRRLEDREDELEDRIQELQEQRTGFTGFIRGIADDLGIGFGWGALYFTAFLTLWRGQTPGKRLFGVRVIRLDGRPLGWWYSFERFGGYAASLSTGLLGFMQILWDANRQGLHDKAVETVVIRDLPASLAAGEGWQRADR
jgi:uncharacterized RDD family membrane protein YckC